MEPKLYSTEEAARYLGKSVSAMKYHIHIRRTLKGRLIGKTLVFTQAELDEFKANLRRQGRPRNKKATDRTRPYEVNGETVHLCNTHAGEREAIGNSTYINQGDHRCVKCDD